MTMWLVTMTTAQEYVYDAYLESECMKDLFDNYESARSKFMQFVKANYMDDDRWKDEFGESESNGTEYDDSEYLKTVANNAILNRYARFEESGCDDLGASTTVVKIERIEVES